MKFLLIEKSGSLKEVSSKNKIKISELYKKCKFRNENNFSSRNIWQYNNIFISLFSKDKGRANTENKYELPPPVDSKLYFGTMIVIAHENKVRCDDEITDMTIDMWNDFYNKAMGGFESLGEEDTFSEEEQHPKEDLTKNGYLKDGFVVDDNEEIDLDDEDDDYIPDCDDITSESSDISMTQEELEAAYGGDSDDEEEKHEEDDYADNEEEDEDEDEDEEDNEDSELEEEEYIYK